MAISLSPITSDAERADALRALGASEAVVAELLAYGASGFDAEALAAERCYPLADEPCVATWAEYEAEAGAHGAAAVLRRHLVQLRFPVEAGTSEREDYRAATRRGVFPPDGGEGVRFVDPDGIRLFLHQTAAGRIPVVVAAAREDFELLLRALTMRNEPKPIPAATGACIVGGYNNWERVQRLGGAAAVAGAPKELYQDRFVLLSSGPYSAAPAEAMGLSADEWRRLSLVIRLEHECAHYFTRRVFGSMRNSLLDELIADYAGIVAAAGRFRADWFLRFMGLERYPAYRAGGRLENYRGTPPISSAAIVTLQTVIYHAARTLEQVDVGLASDRSDAQVTPRLMMAHVTRVVSAIARLGLEAMAAPDGPDRLRSTLAGMAPASANAP